MVRALLNDSKTQTRRVVKLPHNNRLAQWEPMTVGGPDGGRTADGKTIPLQGAIWHTRTGDCLVCPHGQPGDRLWVRETFVAFGRWETRFSEKKGRDERHFVDMTVECDRAYQYASDEPDLPLAQDRGGVAPGWWKRPAIFMPRAASRITLEITGVRTERLQNISEDDAIAEGIDGPMCAGAVGRAPSRATLLPAAVHGYAHLWESLNGARGYGWDTNPWVWVIEFKRITQ